MASLAAKALKLIGVKSDEDITEKDKAEASGRLATKSSAKMTGTTGLDKSHMDESEIKKWLKEKR